MREMMRGGGMGGMGGMGGFGGPQGAGQWPPPGAFGTPAGQGQTGARTGTEAAAGADAGTGTATGAGTGTTGPGQQPPFNPFAGLGGAGGQQGGFDPMAFMNTPMGQMAMQQMMAGGGPPGMGGMFGGAGGAAAAPADTRSPEERFEVQLGQLASMGFTVSNRCRSSCPAELTGSISSQDARANIRALQATGGNVQAALEYLLG